MFPQGPAEHHGKPGQRRRCRQSQAGSGPHRAHQPCHKPVDHHLQPSLCSCPRNSKAGHTVAAAPLISLPRTHGWGSKSAPAAHGWALVGALATALPEGKTDQPWCLYEGAWAASSTRRPQRIFHSVINR